MFRFLRNNKKKYFCEIGLNKLIRSWWIWQKRIFYIERFRSFNKVCLVLSHFHHIRNFKPKWNCFTLGKGKIIAQPKQINSNGEGGHQNHTFGNITGGKPEFIRLNFIKSWDESFNFLVVKNLILFQRRWRHCSWWHSGEPWTIATRHRQLQQLRKRLWR